jgi:superfamily II DNA or RNA helicase
LVVAHTNELLYQLERAAWQFLRPSEATAVLNGYERPSAEALTAATLVFVCLPSASAAAQVGGVLPQFDGVIVDECHHAAAPTYQELLQAVGAGLPGGPFVVGLTATPWRADRQDLRLLFGDPVATIDIVEGLRQGYLSNVDYRLFTDNIRWSALRGLNGETFSPRQINRTLFITEWDDGVVRQLREVWREVERPRAIVFCGTIDHAITMRDRINALGFCNAAAIYSRSANTAGLTAVERNRLLCDFQDNVINVLCAVDILNEGIDVPDVNIIVFQRVTHSRRIFVQQLGRGLRVSEGKDKVIVLDFVSDVRRIAAAIELKSQLATPSGSPTRIRIDHRVEFRRAGSEDPRAETFLRAWLKDITAIETADEDAAVLRFPPSLEGVLDDI